MEGRQRSIIKTSDRVGLCRESISRMRFVQISKVVVVIKSLKERISQMSNSQIEMFTIRWRIALHAIISVLLVSGCASSQLGVDPDYRWVGGRTYTANIKKLQAYSKCELPKCDASNRGEFTVVDSNIEDLKRPLKMVVFSDCVEGGKSGVEQDWELYLYHVVPNAERGLEVVTTVCKSNYGRFEPIHRKEIINYMRVCQSDECKEWRNWAVTTNYNELAEHAPQIMFGQEFSDMIRADVLDPIDDAQKTCGYDDMSLDAARRLSSEALIHLLTTDDRDVPGVNGFSDVSSGDLMKAIERLQELGIIELCGANTMIESSNGDQTYAYRVRNALNNPFVRLRNMASSALTGPGTRSPAFDMVKEMSDRVVAKKLALKKKLDEEVEAVRIKKEREYEMNREADAKELSRLEKEVSTWVAQRQASVEKILSSKNPLTGLEFFAKSNGHPKVSFSENRFMFPESKEKGRGIIERWNAALKGVDWDVINSTNRLERAKAIYALEKYCALIHCKLWNVIFSYCKELEKSEFDKDFEIRESSCPGNLWASVTSCPIVGDRRDMCVDGKHFYFYTVDLDAKIVIARKRSNVANEATKSDGRSSDGYSLDELFVSNRPPVSIGRDGKLRSIFGVEFGATVKKGLEPTFRLRSGLLAYRFVPKKQFMEFKEYYIFASPVTRCVSSVLAKASTNAYLAEEDFDKVVTLLEAKYQRKSQKGNAGISKYLTFSVGGSEQYITVEAAEEMDFLEGKKLMIRLLAWDRDIRESADAEAKAEQKKVEVERQKVLMRSKDADAL